ncbi:thermosome subunit [archaeon]|nr:thermosome subunit [archaeon]
MTQPVQPIFILPENAQRTTGKDAQRNNIMAAKAVAETVRTTLGPKGMDKMLVDSLGDVVVTNDGVTILNEMQIEHPAAKMIVEVAKTQENEVGDGTTTAVVLAGELLKNAEKLLDDNIHPTIISKGYKLASDKAHEILNSISEDLSKDDKETLKKIAITAMTGKGADSAKDVLGSLIVNAVSQVIENDAVDTDDIKIEKKVGGGIEDTELIQGIVLDKEKVHSAMPKSIKDAKIALLDVAIEIKSPETDTKVQISNPEQLQGFLDQESTILKNMTEKVIQSNANVVICQKGIDDIAQHYLSKAGIYAVRRVKKSDMDKLARATNGKVLSNIDDLTEEDLGYAGVVEEIKVGDESFTYVKDCKNPKSVTLLVRGGTEHVVAEIERAINDSIGDITSALIDSKVVAGAGSVEIEVSKQLKEYASTLSGKEQLAVNAFSEALEIIPRTLAENSGLDPVDVLTDLKSSHNSENGKWQGINVFSGKVVNAWDAGVVEPLKIKTQAIKSASEVSELILRIDDIIASSSSDAAGPMPPQGMPQGMPGMGDY